MTSVVQLSYSSEQIRAWLRGLLTIAWADGNFDQDEQEIIAALTQTELAPRTELGSLEPIEPEQLAQILGQKTDVAENFLRTAVMVALADGVYSLAEHQILQEFCEALGQSTEILESLRLTIDGQATDDGSEMLEEDEAVLSSRTLGLGLHKIPKLSPLQPVQTWLDQLAVDDPRVARFLCKMIPSQCPFERNVNLFSRKVVHIPPLCKLNPLYEQLVGLRFRALSYLADDCSEDVTPYL